MCAETENHSDRKMRVLLENIRTDRYDVRDEVDEDHVEQIAESLADDGQWNPIIVRPAPDNDGTYELIAGHTRYRAAEQLGWESLEATVKDVDEQRANELALKTNLKRKGMSKIEEGRVINEMLDDHEMSQRDLAEKIGKSHRWVRERVQVALELDPKVKGLVQEGDLSYNIARIVTQVDDDRQLEFAEHLIDNDVTSAAEASTFKQRFQNDTLFTIGYEGRDFDELVSILEEHGVAILVDVRKSGNSTYKPEFNSDVLGDRLDEAGIQYRHVPELGVDRLIRGPYKEGYIGDECAEGWYQWWIQEESDVDLAELTAQLEETGPPALLCIEESPTPTQEQDIYCHRHYLAEMMADYERNGRQIFPHREDL